MGLAFKENCPDLRNTRVVDVIEELKSYSVKIDVYDPWVDAKAAQEECGLSPISRLNKDFYDGVLVAVAHNEFTELNIDSIRAFGKKKCAVFDLKGIWLEGESDIRL